MSRSGLAQTWQTSLLPLLETPQIRSCCMRLNLVSKKFSPMRMRLWIHFNSRPRTPRRETLVSSHPFTSLILSSQPHLLRQDRSTSPRWNPRREMESSCSSRLYLMTRGITTRVHVVSDHAARQTLSITCQRHVKHRRLYPYNQGWEVDTHFSRDKMRNESDVCVVVIVERCSNSNLCRVYQRMGWGDEP